MLDIQQILKFRSIDSIQGRRDVFKSSIFPFAPTASFLPFTTRDPSLSCVLSSVLRSNGDTSPPSSFLIFLGGEGGDDWDFLAVFAYPLLFSSNLGLFGISTLLRSPDE